MTRENEAVLSLAKSLGQLESGIIDVCGQLRWFGGALENSDLNGALVLKGITRQLEDLADKVAAMEVRS